jgi:hypothetical protein
MTEDDLLKGSQDLLKAANDLPQLLAPKPEPVVVPKINVAKVNEQALDAERLLQTLKALEVKSAEKSTPSFGKDIEIQANHLLSMANQLAEEASMKLASTNST